jgi:hypothetical protein
MYSKSKFNLTRILFLGLWLTASCAYAEEVVDVTEAPILKEEIQLSMMTNYRETNGSFDPYGTYSAYPTGSSVWSTIQVYNLSYRFEGPFEVGMSFATRYSQSTFPTGYQQSQSFGSPSVNGRYHIALDRQTHLIFHAGFGMPYKFSSRKSSGDPSASMNTDGDLSAPVGAPMGGFNARLGTGISKSFRSLPIRLSADATFTHPFSSTAEINDGPQDFLTQSVQRGNQFSLSEGAGYSLSRFWLVSVGFRQAMSTDSYTDGEDMTGTASRLMATNFGITYMAKKDWRVTASYDTEYPFYSYVVNQPYAPSVSVGLSYTGL